MVKRNALVACAAALLLLVLLAFAYLLGRGWNGGVPEHGLTTADGRSASLDGMEERLGRIEREIAALRGVRSPGAPGETGDVAPDAETRLAAIQSSLSTLQQRVEGLEQEPLERGYSYLESENAELRREGIDILARVGRFDPKARAAIRRLLGDPSPRVREQASQRLGNLRDKESAAEMKALLEDPDPATRRRAVQGLAAMDARDAIREIGRTLASDADDRVRETAAGVLRRWKSPEAEESFTKALKDRSEAVRAEAIAALGEIGAASAAPSLREIYDQDPGPHRMRLVLALKSLGDEVPLQKEVGRLTELVKTHADERVRQQAVRELAALARDASQEIFSQAAQDPSPRVRLEAEKALLR